MKKMLFASIAMVCLVACNSSKHGESDESIAINGNTAILPENSNILLSLKVDTVNLSSYTPHFTASGEVKVNPSCFVEINVPYTGRVMKSFVQLGQRVVKGTPLFQMSSSEFFEMSKGYLDAKHEADLAERNLDRTAKMTEAGVTSQRELEEATLDSRLKQQALDNAVASLAIFGLTPDDITLGNPLTIKSPINGKVVKSNLVLGQYLKEDSEPVMEIADLGKVWVVAKVKEKDLTHVEHLKTAEISFVAIPGKTFEGRIINIGDILDPDSRSVEVIIECDNENGELKPNLYATVKMTDEPTEVIVIPSSAILQGEDENYVIKAAGERKFEKVRVDVISSNDDGSVIGGGVKPGDVIVVKGAYYFINIL